MSNSQFFSLEDFRKAYLPAHEDCLCSQEKRRNNAKFGGVHEQVEVGFPIKSISEQAPDIVTYIQKTINLELFSYISDENTGARSSDLIKLEQKMKELVKNIARLSSSEINKTIASLESQAGVEPTFLPVKEKIEMLKSLLEQVQDTYSGLAQLENKFFKQCKELIDEKEQNHRQQQANEKQAIEIAQLKKAKRKSLLKKIFWTTGFVGLLVMFFASTGM